MDPSTVQRGAHSPLGQAIHAQERLTPGGVAGLIAQMQGAIPGPSARDSSSRRGRAQHGNAEQSASRQPGPRSRDRTQFQLPRTPRSSTRDIRAPSANDQELRDLGPQNRQDFDSLMETVNDRLDTLERFQRLHA